MGKASDIKRASDDTYDSDPWDYDYEWDDPTNWEEELARGAHERLCEQVKNGEVEITPELLQSVEDAEWRRELVEAICLRKVNQALEGE